MQSVFNEKKSNKKVSFPHDYIPRNYKTRRKNTKYLLSGIVQHLIHVLQFYYDYFYL